MILLETADGVLKKRGGGGWEYVQRERAETGYPLKLPSPTNLARLGHFPPASQADRFAGPVFYVYVFSLVHSKAQMVISMFVFQSFFSVFRNNIVNKIVWQKPTFDFLDVRITSI